VIVNQAPALAQRGRVRSLESVAEEMLAAYRERVAAGYDREKERADLKVAFLERAASAGHNRAEARKLFRRWF